MTKTTRTLGDAEVFPIGLGGMPLSLEGRPDEDRAIRTILPRPEASSPLRSAALETDVIDLSQFHRPDPDLPYAESIGAFKELQDEGKLR